jgi:hypothetical protein
MLGKARPAYAEDAALLDIVDDRSSAVVGARTSVENALRGAGTTLVSEETIRAGALARYVVPPPQEVDDAFVRRATVDSTGRNLFFESRFEEATEVLRVTAALVGEHPELLAFHPDLVAATLDSYVTLARALDALGDTVGAEAALAEAATVMWAAQLSPEDAPPSVHQRWTAARALIPTREVTVRWRGGRRCAVWLDGSLADSTATQDGAHQRAELRVPGGPHAVEVRCEHERSRVHRLSARDVSLTIDLAWDDALDLAGEGVGLRPRQRDPASLERLSRAALDAVEVDAVYTLGYAEQRDGVVVLELTRFVGDGRDAFRAVRVRADELQRGGALEEAVRYLKTGQERSSLSVWDPEHGWPAAEVARGASVPAWVLGGVSVAALSVAAIFEARTAESLADVDSCADGAGVTCDASLLPALRSDARRARGFATASWATGAALAVGAVTARLLKNRERRGPVDVSVAVAPGRVGVSAAARIRW